MQEATRPEALTPGPFERPRPDAGRAAPAVLRSGWTRRRRPHRSNPQLEFALEPRLSPALHGTRRSHALVPPSRRLPICPEAFSASNPPAPEGIPRGDRAGGLIECAMVMLTTIVFGVGWAALELARPATGDRWEAGYASSVRSSLSEGANPTTRHRGAIGLRAPEAHAWRGEVPDARPGPPNSEGMPWSSKQ
jgi:hypothetical protein